MRFIHHIRDNRAQVGAVMAQHIGGRHAGMETFTGQAVGEQNLMIF